MQPIELQDVRPGEIHALQDAISILRPKFALDAALRSSLLCARTYLAAVPGDMQRMVEHYAERRVHIGEHVAAAERDYAAYAACRLPENSLSSPRDEYNCVALQLAFPRFKPKFAPPFVLVTKIVRNKFYGLEEYSDRTDPYDILYQHMLHNVVKYKDYTLYFHAVLPCGIVQAVGHDYRVPGPLICLVDLVRGTFVRILLDTINMDCIDDYGCSQDVSKVLWLHTGLNGIFGYSDMY